MPKLYRATVEIEVYFLANDLDEANFDASRYVADEVRVNGIIGVDLVEEVESSKFIDENWIDSYPYGHEDGPELTVRQIVEAVEAEAKQQKLAIETEKAQGKLPLPTP